MNSLEVGIFTANVPIKQFIRDNSWESSCRLRIKLANIACPDAPEIQGCIGEKAMRRPPKSFVTEYKGSNRRLKEAGADKASLSDISSDPWVKGGGRSAAEAESWPENRLDAKPRSSAEVSRADSQRFGTGSSEDSYEAALRAADALFSKSSPAKPVENGHHKGAMPPPSVDSQRGHTTPGDTATPPSAGGGRILRSLDEATEPTYADREEAAIPKRRGRKPGTKNKPKVFAATTVEDQDLPWHQHAKGSDTPPRETSPTVPTYPRPAPRVSRAPASRDRVAASSARAAVAPAPARGERFAWVRTKLAPGQRWKRRLPKVIW